MPTRRIGLSVVEMREQEHVGSELMTLMRVHVLASSLNYTEVLIRRHLYPQTMRLRPPFVMGYDVVGEVDQIGDGVRDFQIGDRVADMTVVGSNADHRTAVSDLCALQIFAIPFGEIGGGRVGFLQK